MLAFSLAFAAGPVTIGILTPLTGGAAGTGQAQKEGFELALSEINAQGGVLGQPLKIVIEDTKADPKTALAAFEKLMTENNVSFIAGGYSSSVTLALVQDFKTFQPIILWDGGAVSGVGLPNFKGIEEELGKDPWFFHVHPWDYMNTQASTGFIKFSGAKTVALLHEDSAFGGPGAQEAQKLLEDQGIKVVLNEGFKSTLLGGNGDFRAAISKAAATNADMLFWIGYDSDVVPMTTQIRELKYNPEYIFGAPPGWPADFGQSKVAQCVEGMTGFLPTLPTQAAKTFTDDYKAKFGHVPDNYMAPLAYASLWAYAKAINAAGTTDQQAVEDKLSSMTFSSPLGQWSFKPSEIALHQGFDASMWLVFQYQDGKQQLVYPADKATAPLQSCR
jgi:branched-chain amino acid transport system substrate-binding protein